ncbi:MAG: EVE domain-containing protein [Burkholderiales bacterium]
MEEKIARIIRNIHTLADLKKLETNARRNNALTDELENAIRVRSADLGRTLIAERTGIDLTNLSPAEEKIIQAVSEYVGFMKRKGKDATRTFSQLANRGLIGAAETAVSQSTPTKGFQTLSEAGYKNLSYEKIIIDHPDEFSARANWFSRRRLGLVNDSAKPPALSVTPAQARTQTISKTQIQTEKILQWLTKISVLNDGALPIFTYKDAAAVLGESNMRTFGRALGNIQSRIDFACYVVGLPPLGLAANAPFENAWQQEDRNWAFPIEIMENAAKSRIWTNEDFEAVLDETRKLPLKAHYSWKIEMNTKEIKVKEWAFGLVGSSRRFALTTDEREPSPKRNPAWTRDELILALDLYLRFQGVAPPTDSPEVYELSAYLNRKRIADQTTNAHTFRNPNSVIMKMMSFRRFDHEFKADGRVGLVRGNKLEGVIWDEFSSAPAALAVAVAAIRSEIDDEKNGYKEQLNTVPIEAPYWVFVCNPKKWAIDQFLERQIERDTWGVRPSDRARFAPGQLGIIRVGVDRRTVAERKGSPALKPGIYGLCEVESKVFEGSGASDKFWAPGNSRQAGWPTVEIRYLKTYRLTPLTIEKLRAERPGVSQLLLNGFQAASFPISANDFYSVIELLGENLDDLPLLTDHSEATSNKIAMFRGEVSVCES